MMANKRFQKFNKVENNKILDVKRGILINFNIYNNVE